MNNRRFIHIDSIMIGDNFDRDSVVRWYNKKLNSADTMGFCLVDIKQMIKNKSCFSLDIKEHSNKKGLVYNRSSLGDHNTYFIPWKIVNESFIMFKLL